MATLSETIETEKTSPAATPDQRQNPAFDKAVLAFKDNINKSPTITVQDCDSEANTPTTPQFASEGNDTDDKRLRVLRVTQHILSSILSLAIAILQSLTYAKYQQTKDVPGAWPTHPQLLPTLLLLCVAATALVFDVSSLIVYFLPGKSIAARAFRLTRVLHYFIMGAKGLSFAVATSVCRTAFSMSSGNDLWGWSCSAQADAMQSVNNAAFNCTGSTVAWILAILSIVIEILGAIITMLAMRRDHKEYRPIATNIREEGDEGPQNGAQDEKNELRVRYQMLDGKSDDVHGQLDEMTPKIGE